MWTYCTSSQQTWRMFTINTQTLSSHAIPVRCSRGEGWEFIQVHNSDYIWITLLMFTNNKQKYHMVFFKYYWYTVFASLADNMKQSTYKSESNQCINKVICIMRKRCFSSQKPMALTEESYWNEFICKHTYVKIKY